MTAGFDPTNFGSAPAPVTPTPKPTAAYHVEESSGTKEVNGHTIKKSSGKPVSTESGLLKEIYSPNPQINALPDGVVEANIKAGIL